MVCACNRKAPIAGQAQANGGGSYSEITFSASTMPMLSAIKDIGVSLEAIACLPGNCRIVVQDSDLNAVLGVISGQVCIAKVLLVPFSPVSGGWYEVLSTLANQGVAVDSAYVAENNRLVVRPSKQ